MNLQYHNKIEIKTANKKFCFYNTMLKSVCDKITSFSPFNKCLAIGSGKNLSPQTNTHLMAYLKSYEMQTDFLCDYIIADESSKPFVTKTIIIEDSSLDGQYLTEAGITDSCQDNPIIYNYFSLINDECPNGILKNQGESIVISVTIYLNIQTNGTGLFTLGSNKFIAFLLGEGLSENLYACRGKNIYGNSKSIFREKPINLQKYDCTFEFSSKNDVLNLKFVFDLSTGETNEVVLLVGNSPFARINLQDFRANTSNTQNFTPKTNYVIDMGENVKNITQVKNLTTNEIEIDVFPSNYASSFGDKISLPFNNMFSNDTTRFVSKDGKIICFVVDDSIYLYKNQDHSLIHIETNGLKVQNIINICAFDDFVLVISKSNPYVLAYKIINNSLSNIEIDFTGLNNQDIVSSIFKAEIVLSKNNQFMLGILTENDNFGYCLYLNFDEENNKISFDSMLSNENKFTYILGMQKNNFTDATIMMLKADEEPLETKLVYFYQDKTTKDVYTTLAVQFTENAKEIYTKSRAVIIEKTTSPHIWVYFYPQKFKYTLSLFGEELNDYISTDLHYLIQKLNTNSYKIYNLVGYNTPTEFLDGFPSELDLNSVLDFEFVGDCLLVFTNNKSEKVVAYSLFENSILIENVSTNSDTYEINYNSYNLIGKNNEGVIVKFTIDISL